MDVKNGTIRSALAGYNSSCTRQKVRGFGRCGVLVYGYIVGNSVVLL